MKRTALLTAEDLALVQVPARTESYSPVPHSNIIQAVRTQLADSNISIKDEQFMAARGGEQVIGYFNLDKGDDEMGMRVGFRNSYDKSMSLAFVVGANVWICSNGMISGEMQYLRKHTGDVLLQSELAIEANLKRLEPMFNDLVADRGLMKAKELEHVEIGNMLGDLFYNRDIMSSMQLNIMKKEFKTSKNFAANVEGKSSLWDFYNNGTEALKQAHPSTQISDHTALHSFVMEQVSMVE